MSTRKVNPLINAVNESIRESRDNAHRMHQRAKDLEAQRMLIRAKFSAMLKDFNTAKHYVSVEVLQHGAELCTDQHALGLEFLGSLLHAVGVVP